MLNNSKTSFTVNKRQKIDLLNNKNKSSKLSANKNTNKLVCKLNKALYGLKQSPRL